jgi:hypothetical protein
MEIDDFGLSITSKLGVVRPAASLYDSLFGIPDLPKVDSSITSYELSPHDKKGDILFPFIQGRRGLGSYVDCVLAHAFRVRGYEPNMLLCRSQLDMCFAKKWAPNEESACELCQYMGSEIIDRFGLASSDLSEFDYDPYDYSIKKSQYRSINTDKYARSSARAYLRTFHIDESDEYEREILNRFRRSAMYLVDIAHDVIAERDYDAVISNDSGYIIGGVFLDVAHQHDIPACDVDVGFNPHSLLCGRMKNRSSLPTYSLPNTVQKRLNRPLNENEQQKIDMFMQDRMSGKNVRFDHTKLASGGFSTKSTSETYGAFTNLPWDASLTATDNTAFDNVFAWLEYTINQFRYSTKSDLIIKTHPAEELRETNESIYTWILENHELTENITILPPDTSVNPYKFMEEIDTGIVWNSTSGLEMSYLGIPVIVAGDTHYRGYGFTYDAISSEEYESLLNRDLELDDSMRQLAKRYAHHLFIERHVNFPFYESTDDGYLVQSLDSDQEIQQNSELDVLVESILTNKCVSEVRSN